MILSTIIPYGKQYNMWKKLHSMLFVVTFFVTFKPVLSLV